MIGILSYQGLALVGTSSVVVSGKSRIYSDQSASDVEVNEMYVLRNTCPH